jgi:hypothetical protein
VVIPEFKALEDRLWNVICRRFGIPAQKPSIIKAADMACLVPEFKQLLPPKRIPIVERNIEMLEEHYPEIIEEARKLKIRGSAVESGKAVPRDLQETDAGTGTGTQRFTTDMV